MDFFIRGDGRWKISYVAIDCPTISGRNGKIQLRFQGSNPWYIKLQARNTKLDICFLFAFSFTFCVIIKDRGVENYYTEKA